jgi:hypothetical protein
MDSMEELFGVKIYESKWTEVSKTPFTDAEKEFIQNPVVSEGQYGWNIKFNPHGNTSKEAYLSISQNSDIELKEGVSVDLNTRFHLVLKRGDETTHKVE